MKKILLLTLIVCVSSFAATVEKVEEEEKPLTKTERIASAEDLTSIKKVKIGMSLDEVIGIMGEEQTIGVKVLDARVGSYETIVIKNPYKQEAIEIRQKNYLVAYFYTDIKKADDIVADDELTPLVFKDDVLFAKGWNQYFKLQNAL